MTRTDLGQQSGGEHCGLKLKPRDREDLERRTSSPCQDKRHVDSTGVYHSPIGDSRECRLAGVRVDVELDVGGREDVRGIAAWNLQKLRPLYFAALFFQAAREVIGNWSVPAETDAPQILDSSTKFTSRP